MRLVENIFANLPDNRKGVMVKYSKWEKTIWLKNTIYMMNQNSMII
ncbi:MAG: hypothetical protein BWX55_00019 [Deltaproteobacteria bacterium ADurb.Bin022]|nr:MAG: hypothetical protein BWX55_00019 [Deltaproteobacteria bacterium ADurb.Bin022]